MREDLLDAKAAVDWAESQLLVLAKRIHEWGSNSHEIWFDDTHPETGKKFVKLRNVKALPPVINAETGVIINSIRSSLDILATTLFNRHKTGMPATIREKDIYFPVAASASGFASGKVYKFVKALPDTERKLIESIHLYRGGNNCLTALHDLDVMRKHRKLIDVRVDPLFVSVAPQTWIRGFDMPSVWQGFKENAIIVAIPLNAEQPVFNIPFAIFFDESPTIPDKPIVAALTDFLSFAYEIIRLFDY